MNKIISSLLAVGFMCFSGFNAWAQEKTTIKIDVTVTKDGETKRIVKEIDLSDAENLKELMEQVDGLEDINISVEDGSIEVIVKKNGESTSKVHRFPEKIYFGHNSKKEKIAFMGIVGKSQNGRAVLTQIIEDGPAEKAGFEENDIVLKFDGEKVGDYKDLVKKIHDKKIGDEIKVKVERNGKSEKLDLVLGERFNEIGLFTSDKTMMKLNLAQKKLTEKMKELEGLQVSSNKGFLGVHYNMNTEDGILITKVVEGSAAEEAGLEANDRLIKINGTDLINGQVFTEVMNGTENGEKVDLVFERNGEEVSKEVVLGQRVSAFQINRFNAIDDDMNIFFNSQDHDFDFGDDIIVKILVEKLSSEEEEMVHNALGIKHSSKFEDININVYPNPGEGNFKVEANLEGIESLEMHVFDSKGNEVYSSKNTSSSGKFKNDINLTEFSSGIYYLALKSGDKIFTEKLIKQ